MSPRSPSRYLRIAALGVPFALVALAGQGWLRGVGDLRTPLVIVVAANVVEHRARGAVRLRLRLGPRRLGVRDRDRAGRHGRAFVDGAPARAARQPRPDRARDPARSSRSAPSCSSAPRRCSAASSSRRAICARIGAGVARRAPDRVPALRLPRARPRRDRDRRAGHRRPRAGRERHRRGAYAAARRMLEWSVGAGAAHRRRPARADRRHPARVHERPGRARARARDVAALLPAVAAGGGRLRARRHPHRRRRHALPRARDGGVGRRSTCRSRSRRSRFAGGSSASGARCWRSWACACRRSAVRFAGRPLGAGGGATT